MNGKGEKLHAVERRLGGSEWRNKHDLTKLTWNEIMTWLNTQHHINHNCINLKTERFVTNGMRG